MPFTFIRQTRRAIGVALLALRGQYEALAPGQKRTVRRIAFVASAVPIFSAVAAFGVAPMAPDAALIPIHEVELALATPEVSSQRGSTAQQYTREERIQRGDTLSAVMTRLAISDSQAEQFIRTDASARALYQLKPGRLIEARTDDAGNLVWMRYLHTPADGDTLDAANTRSLVVERRAGVLRAYDDSQAVDRRVELRNGEISTSLFAATDAAGIPDGIASQIADIMSGDIDFYRDLRRGDRFRVVYDMFYQNGEAARAGRILALEFVNAGKVHQAVWFQNGHDSGGYYGFNGQSMRRAFLRAPLQFTRISSGFGGRVHPILNIWRWHTGIDYAAPIGTPIRATGDGTVEFVGTQTGYGNAIQIQHQGAYSTLYGHLSAFASGLHKGEHVAQGQVIGFVGMTGWATGPHLHYEFRIGGVAKDPQRVTMPDALPVAQDQLAAFHGHTDDFTAEIGLLRSIDVARHDATGNGA